MTDHESKLNPNSVDVGDRKSTDPMEAFKAEAEEALCSCREDRYSPSLEANGHRKHCNNRIAALVSAAQKYGDSTYRKGMRDGILKYGDTTMVKFWTLEQSWENLAQKFEISDDGCWMWTGGKDKTGYATCWNPLLNRMATVAKIMKELVASDVWSRRYQPDHLCHTRDLSCTDGKKCLHRLCVNPAHLEMVTAEINQWRSRGPQYFNRLKTHCPAGHAYSEENTQIGISGKRYCRTCRNKRSNDNQKRLRALSQPTARDGEGKK